MILNLLLGVVLCLSAWAYVRWLKVKRHWADRNVPFVDPHPILGNLTFLLKQNPALWFRSYYNNFKAPYVGIWLFWRPALIVNSLDLARKITITDSDSFRDRFLGSVTKDPLRVNLFLAKDPKWTAIRRRLTSVFTSAKLKAFQNLISTKSNQLVERISNENVKKNKIDLKSLFTDFTTDVISITSFGVESEAMVTGGGHMRDVTTGLSSFSLYKGVSWCSIFYFPELADIFGFTFFPADTTKYFRKIFRAVVAQRGGYDADRTQIRDLLDALLSMKQEAAKDGEEMSEDELVAQAAVFLLGGFDTTAMMLTYVVYELAYAAPEIQAKLYKEIVEMKENMAGKEIDAITLASMPYLNCVIQETLRKYPGMGWIDRVATKPYKLDDNLTIPAGTPVYVNSFGLHYDPEYYPEPEKFIPERFLPENEKPNRPFFSFGEGPRHCIGQRVAMQSMRYAVSSMVLNYEFHSIPGAPKPSECHFEKKYLLIQPGEVMSVNFVPRSKNGLLKF